MHHSPFKIEYHSRFPLNGHLAHGDYFDPNFEEIFNEGLLSMLNNEDATDKITSDKKQVLVGLLPSKLAEIRFNITIKDKYLEVNFFNVNIETFKIKETKAPSGYIAGESKEVTLEGFTLFDYKEYDEATNEAAKQREIKIRKDLEDFTRKNHVRLVEFKNKEDFEKDYHSVGDRIKAKFHSPIKLDIINKLDPKEEKPKEEDQVLPEKPNHEDGIKPEEPGKEENAKPQVPEKEEEVQPEKPNQGEDAKPQLPGKEDEAKPEAPKQDEEAQPEVPNKDEEAKPEAPKQDDQKDMEKPKKDDQKGMEKPKQNDHKDMVVPKENDQNIFNKQKENKPEAQKNMQMKESGKSKKDMPNKNLNAKANKDKSMKNPKTGDNNDIVLYSSIVAIAGLSLLAVGFLKKKNNKEEII